MAPSFILHDITNEKTLKLKQIDRLPALPRFSKQKHVPTTLVGIPVDIYTLGGTTLIHAPSTLPKTALFLLNCAFSSMPNSFIQQATNNAILNNFIVIYQTVSNN